MNRTHASTTTVAIFATVLFATCAMAGGEYSTKTGKGDHYKTGVKFKPDVTVGHKATARLWVTATDGWHMNEKFPYKVTITTDEGVTIAKTTLKKADAIKFNDSKIVFKIPYKVTTDGSHTIKAKINLAVCTGDQCIPHVENLSWKVQGTEATGG